jgi:cytochrome c-type biogenesis protein CcmH/NrfF
MPSNDPQTAATQVAPLQIVINPLVNWIWLGFGILAFGTGIALLPERSYSFALSKVPGTEATATTALTLLLLLWASVSPVLAQDGMPAPPAGVDTQTSYYARTPFEKQMQHEIVCTCGCGHINIAECRKDPCATSHQMRGDLAGYIDQGQNHDQILASFVQRYGTEEMIGKPLAKGYRGLSWVLPVTIGGGAAFAIGFVAMRWSRKSADALPESAATEPELDERLDDELRNLD